MNKQEVSNELDPCDSADGVAVEDAENMME
jgi:hypothetical protein